VATYALDVRDAVAAAVRAVLGGTRLVLLSESGTTLADFAMPTLESPAVGTLKAAAFRPVEAQADGQATRYEIRRPTGQVLVSGRPGELRIDPPYITRRGMVYLDDFELVV
jgi:hypothetical protein